MLSINNGLRFAYLSYFSQPPSDRLIYRAIRRHRVRRIVEFGIGLGQRAVRMIETAGLFTPKQEVFYTGADLFEARSSYEGPGLTLKMAHRRLKATGARIQLLPGDPFSVLSRSANGLSGIDLIIISDRQDKDSLARGWFFLPRMLHEGSNVFIEEPSGQAGKHVLRRLPLREIEERAAAAAGSRRAA
jgi:hypothetical protein